MQQKWRVSKYIELNLYDERTIIEFFIILLCFFSFMLSSPMAQQSFFLIQVILNRWYTYIGKVSFLCQMIFRYYVRINKISIYNRKR